MASAGQLVLRVEDVLRARDNVRRIREHYDGTLGVPSALHTLSHLLAHDKEAVFEGLESMPLYRKSSTPPPKKAASLAPSETAQIQLQQQRFRRRQTGQSDIEDKATQNPDPSSLSGVLRCFPEPQETAKPEPLLVPLPVVWPSMPEEEAGPERGAPPRPGLTLDPSHWGGGDERLSQPQAPQPEPDTRSRETAAPPSARSATEPSGPLQGGSGFSPAAGAATRPGSPPSSSRSQQSPYPSRGGEGFGSWGPLPLSPGQSGSLAGSMYGSEAAAAAAASNPKHALARQRLLSPQDLSPQEWAQIGPPQDAVDQERFTAREYRVMVDYDRATFAPQRVARPDIFHIAPEEAQRRQVEADEATLALQAARRAEAEAAERAAEEARLARAAPRGPQYNGMGVLVRDRPASPTRPRYLDWHPEGVGGLAQNPQLLQRQLSGLAGGQGAQGQEQQGGGSSSSRRQSARSLLQSYGSAGSVTGGAAGGGGGGGGGCDNSNNGCSSTPGGPRVSHCVSALRSRAQSAASYGCGVAGQQGSRGTDATTGGDVYVYEDTGEDTYADQDMAMGPAAYGTHPPQRRHHSALAAPSGFAPPPRPPGISDAHYAQIVRQQRKWLNGPVQPPRPVSAAPKPAPLTYVRPRSSRPPPEGTAAPMPSRLAAEAEAVVAAAAALNRQHSALQTVIHQRVMPSPPGRVNRAHTNSWAADRPASAASGGAVSSWASMRQRDGVGARGGGGGGGLRPSSAQQSPSAARTAAGARRQPWEVAREHAAAAVAASIIPNRVSVDDQGWEEGRVTGARRRTVESVTSAGGRSASARRPPGAGGGARGPPARKSSVFGETLPPEATGHDAEAYQPRKFEIHDGMVLDGYMGRLP